MADDVRKHIIVAITKRSDDAQSGEAYVSHLKIWETDDGGTPKSRFILLSYDRNNRGYLHKSKQNPSGSFSIGKTWKLAEVRGLEVVDTTAIKITLSRSYVWQTESDAEQRAFCIDIVDISARLGNPPIALRGFDDDIPSNQNYPTSSAASPPLARPVTPPQINAPSTTSISPRRQRQAQVQSPTEDPYNRAESPYRDRLNPPGANRVYANQGNADLSSHSVNSVYQSSSNRPITPTIPPVPAPSESRTPPRPRKVSDAARPRERVPSRARPTREVESVASETSSFGLAYRNEDPNRRAQQTPPPDRELVSSPSELSRSPPPMMTSSRTVTNIPALSSPPAINVPAATSLAPSLRPLASPKREMTRADPLANARISFFDPANQATADRLIFGTGSTGDEDSMANVEEMLEGIDWGSRSRGRNGGGAADVIEARLLDELTALEKANVHSFLEADDRVALVLKFIDDAIKELDDMDSLVSAYKVQLNGVSDDISHIQSQDRGLQVQTQNQKALLSELQDLLQTVDVDRSALVALTQESLETDGGIQRLEIAAAELYKALLAGRETGMAAGMERLDEYRTHNSQFCKRLLDFLNIAFKFKASNVKDANSGSRLPTLPLHKEFETYLSRYCGLMLYLKEMDEDRYSKLCGNYFSTASELHSREMKDALMGYSKLIKPAAEDDAGSFAAPPTLSATARATGTIKRAKTKARSLADRRDRNKATGGEMLASDALLQLCDLLIPQIQHEQDFLADFLQIGDATLTFADYMAMENYIRRNAATAAGELRPSTLKLVRGALDLIFGFLAEEMKNWIDAAVQKDPQQLVGLIAALEQALSQVDDRTNEFSEKILQRQNHRLTSLFNRQINQQAKLIEQTKLTTKKREGVVYFIKFFPTFVERIENQLVGLDQLPIRDVVDAGYDRIVHAMTDSLQHMAKMDRADIQAGEDKGMLNYHVILIENMDYFVSEVAQLESRSVARFANAAQSIYEENLAAYVKLVLRKSFSRIIDYFDGVERLLQTAAPTEVLNNSAHNKSSLKRVTKDFDSKDIRKNVEALFKRVEKHFDDEGDMVSASTGKVKEGTVLARVWAACEKQLVWETQRFTQLIGQCYADSGVGLEFTVADVESAFRKHKV